MLESRDGYTRPNGGETGEEIARYSADLWLSAFEERVYLFFRDTVEPVGIEITNEQASWLVVEWAQHRDFGIYGETPFELAHGMRYDSEMAILHGIPDTETEHRP